MFRCIRAVFWKLSLASAIGARDAVLKSLYGLFSSSSHDILPVYPRVSLELRASGCSAVPRHRLAPILSVATVAIHCVEVHNVRGVTHWQPQCVLVSVAVDMYDIHCTTAYTALLSR